MPYRTSRTKRQHLDPLVNDHYLVGDSRMFDSTYLAADSNGDKYLYAGCVLAVDSSTSKYVPYNVSASYGTGSDTAICVTKDMYDMTLGAKAVTGVVHGQLIEERCYIFGGATGTITSAVKTALKNIMWV